jgi:phosphohistidine phosphatase
MKELWILRHAHAEPYLDEKTDFDRHLDARGRREAASLGRLALALQLGFDQVLVSPAARTRATARGITDALGIPRGQVREEAGIYLADRKALVGLVRALPADCHRVLLVGHNPGVSRLVRWATDDDDCDDLRPATLVGTRADLKRWDDAEKGRFERLRVLRPEDASP